MKLTAALLTVASLAATAVLAADYPRVIFADDFAADGFGKAWGHYKSSSVVKGGVLVGITGETSDHSAVDNIRLPGERDLEVSVKFRFVSDKAKSFNVWFDDKDYKGSHAGHICQCTVSPTGVTLADAKEGNFRKDLYDKQKTGGGWSAEDKKYVASKRTTLPVKLVLNDWHTLVVQTEGEEVRVSIDGTAVGSFKSSGIAHTTKSLVSLTTNRVDVEYDDFSLKGVAKP